MQRRTLVADWIRLVGTWIATFLLFMLVIKSILVPEPDLLMTGFKAASFIASLAISVATTALFMAWHVAAEFTSAIMQPMFEDDFSSDEEDGAGGIDDDEHIAA